MKELSFKGIGKILEGYIEFLSLIPYLNDFKLEHIETDENSIFFVVSTTKEVMKMNDTKPLLKLESETHKRTTTFHITQETKITKGDF